MGSVIYQEVEVQVGTIMVTGVNTLCSCSFTGHGVIRGGKWIGGGLVL